MATMDSGNSGQTSAFYSLSDPTGGATALPKDLPFYISIEQLIS